MKNVNDYLLTSNVTVGQLRGWMAKRDNASKEEIVELIYHRFFNRYVRHLDDIDSGFLRMAIACLMIETLESFKQGVKDTKKKGEGLRMFKDFFRNESDDFPEFDKIHKQFYYNIRCGILHQAETTNAWRILSSGQLLNIPARSINSVKVVHALKKVLDKYTNNLRLNELGSAIWDSAFLKLEDICENCEPK